LGASGTQATRPRQQLYSHGGFTGEHLWINIQHDPDEARAQLVALRRSVLKLTGEAPVRSQTFSGPIFGVTAIDHTSNVSASQMASIDWVPAVEKVFSLN
jgi:hypothetical protein